MVAAASGANGICTCQVRRVFPWLVTIRLIPSSPTKNDGPHQQASLCCVSIGGGELVGLCDGTYCVWSAAQIVADRAKTALRPFLPLQPRYGYVAVGNRSTPPDPRSSSS